MALIKSSDILTYPPSSLYSSMAEALTFSAPEYFSVSFRGPNYKDLQPHRHSVVRGKMSSQENRILAEVTGK